MIDQSDSVAPQAMLDLGHPIIQLSVEESLKAPFYNQKSAFWAPCHRGLGEVVNNG